MCVRLCVDTCVYLLTYLLILACVIFLCIGNMHSNNTPNNTGHWHFQWAIFHCNNSMLNVVTCMSHYLTLRTKCLSQKFL